MNTIEGTFAFNVCDYVECVGESNEFRHKVNNIQFPLFTC